MGVPLRISEARDGLAGTCDSCGEAGAAECTFAVGMTLWLCDACDCGYVGGGAETEGLLDHYVEMVGLDAEEEADLRERILDAHARLPLPIRGARVAGLLASMN